MKNKLLAFVLMALCAVPSIAQDSVVVSGTCTADTNALGTYNYWKDINGRRSYYLGVDTSNLDVCSDQKTKSACNHYDRYLIRWDGSKWLWLKETNALGCQWFGPAQECIPDPNVQNLIDTLATSSSDVIQPNCGTWIAELNGCTPNFNQCITVGIAKNDFAKKIKLYPNPTKGSFTVDLKNYAGKVSINVFNIQGKLIETKNGTANSLVNFELKQSAGMYFVSINTENGATTHLKLFKR